MQMLWKKSTGAAGVFDAYPIAIMIILAGSLLIFFTTQITYFHRVDRLENYANQILLRMESTNGLTNDDLQEAYTELYQMGFEKESVRFDGTSFASDNIEYGNQLRLRMQVVIPYYDFGLKNSEQRREIIIEKCTLALGA